MTRYILNSGGLRNKPELAKLFFAEVVKGLGPQPKILICFFAVLRESWEQKFGEYSQSYAAMSPEGVSPVFELTLPETFAEQMHASDAIIIQGGDDHLIQYWLKQFDLPQLWEGKTVAGSSAGSDALVTHFWTGDWRTTMNGLGLVPIKFIAHYESQYGENDPRGPINWKKAYEELKNYGDQTLPIYALHEGNFVVIEK
jgi:hypothetical protein